MLDCFKCINMKKTGIFAAGVLFGTAGVKLLASKDAKKVYTNCTAAVLRAKECVMKTATTIQENAEDIYEEAKEINAKRASEERQTYLKRSKKLRRKLVLMMKRRENSNCREQDGINRENTCGFLAKRRTGSAGVSF